MTEYTNIHTKSSTPGSSRSLLQYLKARLQQPSYCFLMQSHPLGHLSLQLPDAIQIGHDSGQGGLLLQLLVRFSQFVDDPGEMVQQQASTVHR